VSRIWDDIFGMLFPVCKMASIFNLHARRCMAHVHCWLLSLCALYYVDLARTDDQPAKPGGKWRTGLETNRERKLELTDVWNIWVPFKCEHLSYKGSKDYRRGQGCMQPSLSSFTCEMSVEDWAYCVTHCMDDAAKSVSPYLVGYAEQSLPFFVGVNRWLMSRLEALNSLYKLKCENLLIVTAVQFNGYIAQVDNAGRMVDCKTSCPHKQRQNEPAHPTSEGCILQQGQVSITAIQDEMNFPNDIWSGTEPEDKVCQWCTEDSSLFDAGKCVLRENLRYPTDDPLETIADLQAVKAKWPYFVFYNANFPGISMDKLNDAWDSFLGGPFIDHVNSVTQEHVSCGKKHINDFPHGVSTSCLYNKGALTGRLCDFKTTCFSREDVFGKGSTDKSFVIRQYTGIVTPTSAIYAQWFATIDLCLANGNNPIGPYSNRELSFENIITTEWPDPVFKLIMGECDTCPGEQGVIEELETASGIVTCADCSPTTQEVKPFYDRTVCRVSIPYNKCVDCEEHAVRDIGGTETCKMCATLGGGLTGSHRLNGEEVCKDCDIDKWWSAGTQLCNTVKSFTFQTSNSQMLRADQDYYKSSEYGEDLVRSNHFRNDDYEEQSCKCSTVHKYAHLCAGYVTDDAYVHRIDTGDTVKLTDMVVAQEGDVNDITKYVYRRQGVCKWCLPCAEGEYNDMCKDGVPGQCKPCMNLDTAYADSICDSDEYLRHDHYLGCAQTRARSDYECAPCKTLVKVKDEFMLAVGCGNQDFKRWDPYQNTVDGVLQSAICPLTSPADEQDIQACEYKSEQFILAPKGQSYSKLIPYCPPSWYFSCELKLQSLDMLDTAEYDPECCTKCTECKGSEKKGVDWKTCTGKTQYDSQNQCQERCENNMYETRDQCVPCNTCKDGELEGA